METKKVILVVVIIGVVAAGLWFLLGSQFGVGTFLTQKQPVKQPAIQPYFSGDNQVTIPPEIEDRVFVMTERGEEKINDYIARGGNTRSEGTEPTVQPKTGFCILDSNGNEYTCTGAAGCHVCHASVLLRQWDPDWGGLWTVTCECTES